MHKVEAVRILYNCIVGSMEETIQNMAEIIIERFNEGDKPDADSNIVIPMQVVLPAQRLYDIEKHLSMRHNGED